MSGSKSQASGSLQSPLITADCLVYDSEFNRIAMRYGVNNFEECWGSFITENEQLSPQNISRWRFAWEEYVLSYKKRGPRKTQNRRKKTSDSSPLDPDIWDVKN